MADEAVVREALRRGLISPEEADRRLAAMAPDAPPPGMLYRPEARGPTPRLFPMRSEGEGRVMRAREEHISGTRPVVEGDPTGRNLWDILTRGDPSTTALEAMGGVLGMLPGVTPDRAVTPPGPQTDGPSLGVFDPSQLPIGQRANWVGKKFLERYGPDIDPLEWLARATDPESLAHQKTREFQEGAEELGSFFVTEPIAETAKTFGASPERAEDIALWGSVGAGLAAPFGLAKTPLGGAFRPTRRLGGPVRRAPDAPDAPPMGAPVDVSPQGVDPAMPLSAPRREMVRQFGPQVEPTGYQGEFMGDPTRRTAIERQIAKAIGRRVKIGGKRGVRGEADRVAGDIRVKRAGDIDALAHEAGHFAQSSPIANQFMVEIADMNGPQKMALMKELTEKVERMYPDGIPEDVSIVEEGFAEAIREWVLEPDIAGPATRQQAAIPDVRAYLSRAIANSPESIRKEFMKARQMAQDFENQGPTGRYDAQMREIGYEPVGQGSKASTKTTWSSWMRPQDWEPGRRGAAEGIVKDATRAMRRSWVDGLDFLREAQMDLEGEIFADSLYEKAQVFSGTAGARAMAAVERGAIGPHSIPSLQDALAPLRNAGPERARQAIRLTNARRASDYDARGLESGFRPEDTQDILHRYGGDPELNAIAQAITDFNDRVHYHNLVERGGMDPATYAKVREANPNYVRWDRIFDERDLGRSGGAGAAAWLGDTDRFKRITGSQREFKHILQAAIEGTEESFRIGDAMEIQAELGRLADLEDGGRYFTKKDIPLDKYQATVDEMVRELRKKGVDVSEVPEELRSEMLAYYRMRRNLAEGKNEFVLRSPEGKRTLIEVDPDIARAIDHAVGTSGPEAAHWVVQLAMLPARAIRSGAVVFNPLFTGANFPRDLSSYTLFTKAPRWHGPKRIVPSGVEELAGTFAPNTAIGRRGSRLRDLYEAQGVMASTITKKSRIMAASDLLPAEATTGTKIRKALGWVPDKIQEFNAYFERLPRMAEFKNSLESQGYRVVDIESGKNVPGMEALRRAGLDARDVTVNFARSGEMGRKVNQFIPFFNAAIQGFDKVAREMGVGSWHRGISAAERGRRLARFGTRGVALLTAPALAHWASVRDEEWYKRAPLWEKNAYWLYSPDDGKTIYRMAKPHIVSAFANIPVAAMEEMIEADPSYADELRAANPNVQSPIGAAIEETLRQASLPYIPPSIGVPFEVAFNKSLFSGKDIEPRRLQDASPHERYTDRTTKFARSLGEPFGLSPLEIDHIITSVTGGLGRTVIDLAEDGAESVGLMPEDETGRWSRNPLFKRMQSYDMASQHYIDFYSLKESIEQHLADARLQEQDPKRPMTRLKPRDWDSTYARHSKAMREAEATMAEARLYAENARTQEERDAAVEVFHATAREAATRALIVDEILRSYRIREGSQ